MLASIYLGQITNWNSPAIKSLNKGVNLPNLKITPIYRSDGSGDTYAFTNYLTDVSGTWKSKVNYSTSVSFPTGVGQKGNSGVTAALESTNGGHRLHRGLLPDRSRHPGGGDQERRG